MSADSGQDVLKLLAALTWGIADIERKLNERIAWLRKEANAGGNWEYLKAKWEECELTLKALAAMRGGM